VKTILGSCVALLIWSPRRAAGGLAHYVLADNISSESASERFGEVAIPALIDALIRLGADAADLRARLFGGANMLHRTVLSNETIGARNVELAQRRLSERRIPVVSSDVGGTFARRLTANLATGEYTVEQIRRLA
jgi:chemotaxis protein CheD